MNPEERKRRTIESLPKLNAIADDLLHLSSRVGSSGLVSGNVMEDARKRARYMALRFVATQDEHLTSLRTLVRGGKNRNAFLIARSMIEGMTQLLWAFDNQPHGPDLWFWYVVIEEWRQLEKNKANGVPVDPEVEAIALLLLGQHGSNYLTPKARKKANAGDPLPADPYRRKWINLDAATVFRETQYSNLYETVYRAASDWVHWSPRALQLAASDNRENQQHQIHDPTRAAQALSVGGLSLLQALDLINHHFHVNIGKDLTALYERLGNALDLDERR